MHPSRPNPALANHQSCQRALGWLALLLGLLLVSCAKPHTNRLSLPTTGLSERIWDVKQQRFISPEAVFERAAGSRYVLLGERHDNPIHHAHQLELLQELAKRQRSPALAMEQFDVEHQAGLSAMQQAGSVDAETLAQAGQLDRTGWNWPLYQALIAYAAEQHWPLLAANLSRRQAQQIARGQVATTLPALNTNQITRLQQDIIDGHCGMQPGAQLLTGMVNAQRARDWQMAKVLDSAPSQVVFIAGAGHVRRDRGVPVYLRQPKQALSIAYVEVAADKTKPTDYYNSSDDASFDLLWFTAAVMRPDPCSMLGPHIKPAAPKPSVN